MEIHLRKHQRINEEGTYNSNTDEKIKMSFVA